MVEGTIDPAPVPAPAPTPTPQFALAPTLNPQQANFIDYGTKEGQKLFEVSSAAHDLDKKFDGKGNEIIIFKQALKDRADFAGWTLQNSDIMSIPTGVGGDTKDLIDNYGVITES